MWDESEEKMCKTNESTIVDLAQIRSFNKYLVFYSDEEHRSGIKGIRSDAPKEAIDEFIEWYRDNHRYENGRLRPLSEAMKRKLMVDVSKI